ncbi:hypothetical protein [Streptomyces griseus]|nr:hypothetical protein [Streptomyces griseus]
MSQARLMNGTDLARRIVEDTAKRRRASGADRGAAAARQPGLSADML